MEQETEHDVRCTVTNVDIACCTSLSVQNIQRVNIWGQWKGEKKESFRGLCRGWDLINLTKSIFTAYRAERVWQFNPTPGVIGATASEVGGEELNERTNVAPHTLKPFLF